MNRRQFLSTGAAVPAAAPLAAQTARAASRPPNILLILFDKCRTDAIGAYDERPVHTPHIDQLARSGVRFANCYTPQALCGPARASILTGAYPHTHGLRRNVYPYDPSRLNSNYPEFVPDPFRDPRFRLWDNFPFLLNNAGYATGYIGKWHLGPANPGFFDYWKGFNSGLRHWIGEPHNSRYRPDVHTDEAVRFVERADQPFFLCVSHYSPHEPLDPPRQYLERYQGMDAEHAGYYGSVTNLDANVGRLVEALDRKKLLDDTLVVLTTEHGRTWRPRPGTAEGMCVAYEESSRIPLIVRYPSRFPAGMVWQSGVSLVDLMPTILATCNVNPHTGAPPANHGQDLAGLVRSGEDRWTRPLVMQNLPQHGIDGSYYDERALRTERYKLILRKFDARPEFRPGELYDMTADRGETRNLYTASRDTVRTLALELAAWGRAHGDSVAERLGEAAAA